MRFVDSSFWIALFLPRDPHHDEARMIWTLHPKAGLTTNRVLGETWTFLRRRAGHREGLRFVDAATRSPTLTIEHVDEGTEDQAWRWLRRRDEREYSFVDATSFATMRRLRLR